MPITGRTAKECADTFREHIAGLLSKTISRTAHLDLFSSSGTYTMSYQVDLDTKFGRLRLHVAQALRAVGYGKGRCRLETSNYWYRLHRTSGNGEALLRWEYDRSHKPENDKPPRHHAHAPVEIDIGGDVTMDLDKMHLPTGWVTIEEVIRFAITELGHRPPCGNEWPKVLAESEGKFFEDFTGKRLKQK